MKKIDFKTRMQWGWFKAALFGVAVAVLIAPTAGTVFNNSNSDDTKQENPILTVLSSISFGPKYKVMINGEVVAIAKSQEAAEEAYKDARLAYNADGVKILNVDVSYAEVDKEKDTEAIKKMKVLRSDQLSQAILESLDKYGDKNKALAYTMRIDDYTVTVDSMNDLVSILEQAQGQYDTEDAFQVSLQPPASRNVTMYEVDVKEKEITGNITEAAPEDGQAATEENTGETTETEPETSEDAAEGEPTVPEEGAGEAEDGDQSAPEEGAGEVEDGDQSTPEEGAGEAEDGDQPAPEEGTDEGTEDEQPQEEVPQVVDVSAEIAAQAANDGVKYVGFSEIIQVMETYVDKSQIKDRETAFLEITAENEEESIYVVQPGDSLSVIAMNNDMTVEDIKMLNPHIESDDDIYYDDRLNITVPQAAVQILVEKQETYEEEYNADIVYEDDADMYIGESEVIQEGSSGRHTVTDLVTYVGDLEADREQLQESVQVAAVAQIIRRGTKSKPTYMFPVTNWNVTSNFGYRWGRLHAGTDVGVPIGTTVRASRGGRVVTAGWVGGYGNCVMIDHGDGVVTLYGHLSEFSVSVGQYVDQGQQIALSGNTGRSTGPHLHFEIRVNGVATDAIPYLYQ